MKYVGNKNIDGVKQQIKSLIAPYDLFIELFAGSAAVSQFISAPPEKLWLNDLIPETVEHFVYTSGGYKLTHLDAIDILQQISSTPAGVYTEMTTGSGAQSKASTGSLYTDSSTRARGTLIFADPPYLPSTRPHSLDLYGFEPSDEWHVRFLECIQKCMHRIIIIHPVCQMYCDALKDWNYIEVKIRYRVKTSVERIWYNFPPPVEVVDYTAVGKNRTDRQRIKRQVNNIISKLETLPELQRNYVLKLVCENFKIPTNDSRD